MLGGLFWPPCRSGSLPPAPFFSSKELTRVSAKEASGISANSCSLKTCKIGKSWEGCSPRAYNSGAHWLWSFPLWWVLELEWSCWTILYYIHFLCQTHLRRCKSLMPQRIVLHSKTQRHSFIADFTCAQPVFMLQIHLTCSSSCHRHPLAF